MGSEGYVTNHVEVSHTPAAHECIKSENTSSGSPLKSPRTEPNRSVSTDLFGPPPSHLHILYFLNHPLWSGDIKFTPNTRQTHGQHVPVASSGKPALPLHWSLCHEPAAKTRKKKAVISFAAKSERSAGKCSSGRLAFIFILFLLEAS